MSGWEALGAALDGLRKVVTLAADHVPASDLAATASDALHQAEALAAVEAKYALVEMMGYRRLAGTVAEVQFLGKPMLEVHALDTGTTQLVSAESLYQLTWMTRDQAERATRTGAHSPAALTAAVTDDIASWDGGPVESHPDDCGCRGCEDRERYERELAQEGMDTGMSASEREAYDRDAEFRLDAAEEAAEMASQHLEDDE